MKEEYAYGDWEVDGKSCPLRSASLDGAEFAGEVAEEFDAEVSHLETTQKSEGTVSREEAKQAFIRMRERSREAMGRNPELRDYHSHIYELCVEVLEEEFGED